MIRLDTRNFCLFITMAATPITDFFQQDPSRIVGEIYYLMRVTGRMSAMMMKGEAPEQQGFNYQTVLWDRSGNAADAVWTTINGNSLGNNPNTCTPTPLQVDPASNLYNYQLQQTRIQSNEICMQDVRAGYMYRDQILGIRDNFKALVVDIWERQDKFAFFSLPGNKIVANAALTNYQGQSDFGTAIPTSTLTAGILRNVYEQLVRDAGGEEPIAMYHGAPQFPLLLSPEMQESILQQDTAVREDIRFAQMGEGETGWLLNSWNVDRAYVGFLFTVDVKMPRWDFNYALGTWVERPFYTTAAATTGTKLIPNPAYATAAFEDSYIFLPKSTIRRDMPRPFTSGGSDVRFDPVNFNGDIQWLNIPEKVSNPLGLMGFYMASLAAAYKPLKPEYAYVIRSLRCSNLGLLSCY